MFLYHKIKVRKGDKEYYLMKINDKILSIPPFISTPWGNISSIQMEDAGTLTIILLDNTKVNIPNLSEEDVKKIFNFHALSLENPTNHLLNKHLNIDLDNPGMVLSGMENFTGMMQHDPSQSKWSNFTRRTTEQNF